MLDESGGTDINTTTHLPLVKYGYRKTIRSRLPQTKFECSESDFKVFRECLKEFRAKELECPEQLKFTALDKASSCKKQDVTSFKELSERVSWMNASSIIKDMDCPLSCQVEEFVLEVAYSGAMPCPVEHFPNGCQGIIAVGVTKTDDKVDYITEKWLYDKDNFLSDVGGILGLTLGVSVLSLYDLVAGLLGKKGDKCQCCYCMRNQSKKKKEQKSEHHGEH